MSIQPILHPLSGEQVLALSPEDAAAARAAWLKRPNLFPGRALTAATLESRSRWAAGRIVLRGQAFAAGVVRGLRAGFEIGPPPAAGARAGVRWEIEGGQGLAASGEVLEARTMVADFWSLPVVAPPVLWGDEDAGFGSDSLQLRAVGPSLGELLQADPARLPRAGVLVLQPVRVDQDDLDPDDPCDQCACGDGNVDYEDRRFVDAARLLWYAWPEDWQALPGPGDAFRNRLAYAVFDRERQLAADGLLPWEEWGVPVALVGVDADFLPLFADHAAVARRGGRGRHSRLLLDGDGRLLASPRQPTLWQAQLEQLAEHFAAFGDVVPDAAALAAHFDRMPPCGLLPRGLLDLSTRRSGFFPEGMDLDAVPVPMEQLDLAIRDSAGLAPLDMARGERIRLLVPVSQASFEPRLLLTETLADEFQQTLDAFVLRRADALAARQGLRLKGAVLYQALRGDAPDVPALDADPLAMEPEDLSGWGPPPAQGGHRSAPTAGLYEYGFEGATATMKPTAGGVLYGWAYLDPQQPPRMLMLEWHDSRGTRRAWWGERLLERGKDGSPEQLYMGELPETGRWARLDVPAASLEAGDLAVSGMGFVLVGGRAAFAASGHATGEKEVPWFDVALPEAAKPYGAGFDFIARSALLAPLEADMGVAVDAAAPAQWPDGTSTALRTLAADPRLTGLLSDSEQAQLPARGIEGFAAYLKDRADRADDLVDYGFVKVQTDIYRIRQLMLDTTEATRLAVSPALAGIAQAETAVATQERLSSFFTDLRKNESMATLPAAQPQPGAGGGTVPGTLKFDLQVLDSKPQSTIDYLGAMFVTPASEVAKKYDAVAPDTAKFDTGITRKVVTGRVGSARAGAGIATKATAATTSRVAPVEAISSGARAGVDLAGALGGKQQAVSGAQLVQLQTGIAPVTAWQGTPAYTVVDVVNASPLVGNAHVRTLSIAERLKPPKAEEARDYATSTRHEAVQGLLRLADQLVAQDGEVPGLFEDIDVWGLAGDEFGADSGGNTTTPPKRALKDFITIAQRPALMTALLRPPLRQNADEASYFSDSADMADRTIALFRQVEGRVKRYREAIAACEQAREALLADIATLAAGERAAGERLAEARHDVAVARALIAEEQARLDAINARRAAILEKEVRFLAYVRPRAVDNLAAAISRPLDPGLLEAAAPACLQDHADVPDELDAMLAVLREAPADWFVHAPALLDRLDRTDLLLRVVQTAQLRTQLAQQRPALALQAVQGVQVTRVATAVGQVRTAQLQAVTVARSASLRLDPGLLASATWQGVRGEAAKVVSLGDLIDGDHGQARVARDAAALFDGFGRICACLHAGFSMVPPSIRLDWAETLSQFDQAPALRNLASLPRWSEIAYADRRRMQGLADWLFDQVEPRQAQAQSLANDLVRMCLLLASHAPVGRIIAGRLPRPTLVKPGLRIPLVALEPSRLRIGMQALLYRGDQVVATARVEDLGAGEASARVLQASGGGIELDTGVRVQFAEAASVSLAAVKQAAVKARG